MGTLKKIQAFYEQLSKSERKVADIIMASPETTIHSSIATLAKISNVSEPTVNRFCRRLETKGFPDFKLHLAQSIATGTPYVNRNVEEDDTAASYTSKIFETAMACLNDVKKNIDTDHINRAVDLLSQAKRISFFGLGASASVAHDALNKFFRFNIPTVYFNDILMQRMSCINCTKGDVVVIISHTGRTISLIDVASIAKKNGATVIGITEKDSPLDKVCSFSICLNVPEDTDIYMPMASRIVQMTVIDVLVTGVTLRRGPAFRENLKKVKEAIKDSRFNKEGFNDEFSQ